MSNISDKQHDLLFSCKNLHNSVEIFFEIASQINYSIIIHVFKEISFVKILIKTNQMNQIRVQPLDTLMIVFYIYVKWFLFVLFFLFLLISKFQ